MKGDATAQYSCGTGQNTQDRAARQRFARAAFSDKGKRLSGMDSETYITDDRRCLAEPDAQVVNLQQGLHSIRFQLSIVQKTTH